MLTENNGTSLNGDKVYGDDVVRPSRRAPERPDSPERRPADPVKQLLDAAPVNVFYADLDGTITYANPAALRVLRSLEQHLPIAADKFVGRSLDLFDPKTGNQRRAFWHPRHLPNEVLANLGPERLKLVLTAVVDGEGKDVGVMVTWDVVTRALALEETSAANAAQLAAIEKSQAVIEFEPDGTIRKANDTFLRTMRCSLDEIKGRHHSIFVDEKQRNSQEYRDFWPRLGRGEFVTGEFKRVDRTGTELWLQASYNPVLDASGKVTKVVKVASDVTAAKVKAADAAGQLAAIDRAQAVIEFDLDGTIRTANANFLNTVGYSLDEVKGKHHGMFVEDAHRRSAEYRDFWARLASGEYVAGEFKRVGRGGKVIWIQASYNPIFDLNGKPFKVVKYASETTAQVNLRLQMAEVLAGVARNAQSLSIASEELSAVSQQMSANAEETSAQAGTVSAASEQVSRNVQTVATGTEEMSASIREIAKNAAQAARVASSAVSVAASTNTTVEKLGESSAEVGKVIKVITSIAQQTKLLALNATIEAARAGEAGKGFAVVANEVKELAKETAKATEDISQKIEAIQSDTRGAVVAIAQISDIINQINSIQTTIASAVEEQTATTNEMSRNVAEGAKGTEDIAKNITGVAQAAQDTSAGAARALKSAKALAGMAVDLEKLVATLDGKR